MSAPATPRPYISWSQLNCLERSEADYIDRYILGRQYTNKAMELGKELATSLEAGIVSDNAGVAFLQEFLPEFQHREYKIDGVEIEGVPLMGLLDGFGEEPLAIDEVKTGKLWTQRQVDETGQLDFYALLVWLKFKKLPEIIRLHWAETRYNPDTQEYEPTGKIKTFTTKREMRHIITMSTRCVKAWKRIKRIYKDNKHLIPNE